MSGTQQASAKLEERVADGMRRAGFPAAQRMRVRHPDRGDIGGVDGWTIEVKGIAPGNGTRCPTCGLARGRFDIAGAMDQMLNAQAANGTPYGVVIRQRKNALLERLPCIVEFGTLTRIMRELQLPCRCQCWACRCVDHCCDGEAA